jgi:hypothetical protein
MDRHQVCRDRARCTFTIPHAAAIIIGQKARLGFATLGIHRERCCLPRSSAAISVGLTFFTSIEGKR